MTEREFDSERERALTALSMRWMVLAPIFKTHHFRSENEWRIVCGIDVKNQQDFIKSRNASTSPIPYAELDIIEQAEDDPEPKLPLSEVVTGPTVDAELSESSLNCLLSEHRYGDVTVRRSDIPLRDDL